MLTTTLKLLREHDACTVRYDRLASELGAGWADDAPITLLRGLETNGLDDTLWALCAVEMAQRAEAGKMSMLLACDCAERVLPIFEKAFPDDSRPREMIEVLRRFARGEATEEELDAATSAAVDARAAADAAADVAWYAARSAARAVAWYAARSATRYTLSTALSAWYAARSAASTAASAAARSALSAAMDAASAAMSAASAAAGDARAAASNALSAVGAVADDAAMSAEKEWQIERLRWYLEQIW